MVLVKDGDIFHLVSSCTDSILSAFCDEEFPAEDEIFDPGDLECCHTCLRVHTAMKRLWQHAEQAQAPTA